MLPLRLKMLYETSQINLENMIITFVHVAPVLLLSLKQKWQNPDTETQIHVNFSNTLFTHTDDIICHEKKKRQKKKISHCIDPIEEIIRLNIDLSSNSLPIAHFALTTCCPFFPGQSTQHHAKTERERKKRNERENIMPVGKKWIKSKVKAC